MDAACREMRSAVVYEMLKDNPGIPLIDLRKPGEQGEIESRLPNAQEFPLDKLATVSDSLLPQKEKTIVVFGKDGDTGRRGCQLLSARGFRYVIFISDGVAGWVRNGLPLGSRSGSPN